MAQLTKRDLYLAGLITEGHYNAEQAPKIGNDSTYKKMMKDALTRGLYSLREYKKNNTIRPIEVSNLTESKLPIHNVLKNYYIVEGVTSSNQFNNLLRNVVQTITKNFKGTTLTEGQILNSLQTLVEPAYKAYKNNLQTIVLENNIAYPLWTKKKAKRISENYDQSASHTANSMSTLLNNTDYNYFIDYSKLDEVIRMVFFAILLSALSKIVPNMDINKMQVGQNLDSLNSLKAVLGPFDIQNTLAIATEIA